MLTIFLQLSYFVKITINCIDYISLVTFTSYLYAFGGQGCDQMAAKVRAQEKVTLTRMISLKATILSAKDYMVRTSGLYLMSQRGSISLVANLNGLTDTTTT